PPLWARAAAPEPWIRAVCGSHATDLITGIGRVNSSHTDSSIQVSRIHRIGDASAGPCTRASENLMKSRGWTLCLVTALVLGFVPAARAVSGCSNELLNGGFALQYSGTATVTAGKLIGGLAAPANTPTSGAVTVNAVARFTLTSDGTISGYSWGSIQGAWVQ